MGRSTCWRPSWIRVAAKKKNCLKIAIRQEDTNGGYLNSIFGIKKFNFTYIWRGLYFPSKLSLSNSLSLSPLIFHPYTPTFLIQKISKLPRNTSIYTFQIVTHRNCNIIHIILTINNFEYKGQLCMEPLDSHWHMNSLHTGLFMKLRKTNCPYRHGIVKIKSQYSKKSISFLHVAKSITKNNATSSPIL